MFLKIMEKCIIESGEKAAALNKLYDAFSKIKIAYAHFEK